MWPAGGALTLPKAWGRRDTRQDAHLPLGINNQMDRDVGLEPVVPAGRQQRALTKPLPTSHLRRRSYRGRASLSAGGATEAGGASGLVDDGGATAERKNERGIFYVVLS